MQKIYAKFKNPTPILVIGGAGYIGAHICKELAQNGFYPITYDDLSTGHSYAVQWGPLIQAELSDKKTLEKVFKKYQPKAVIHFAGNALVMESIRDPGKYYANNVSATITLLQTMKKFEVKSLVFSSSCATYGNPEILPICESHPQNPINPYGRSKLMVEQICKDFEEAYGIHSVCFRYFNAAGADLDCEIGENHTPETHIIPLVIKTAMGLRDHLSIFGTDFPTPDGSAIRDFIHVKDLSIAHFKALLWLLQKRQSLYVNLGTGNGLSVKEIIRTVEQFSKNKIPTIEQEKREGEPPMLVADFEMAKRYLNWSPNYSDLKTIISSAWNWHQYLIKNREALNEKTDSQTSISL